MGKPRGRKLQKKQQRDEFEPPLEVNHENEQLTNVPSSVSDPQMFFGVLDREELEYFKQAEATLSIDAFESTEEKQHFVTSVCDELKGKEYKLVTSQICSKLVERLILECGDDQLKSIFKAFNGVFYNLSCHKYASHVLETLFVRGAALVEKELLTPSFDGQQDDEPIISMENAFLYMLNEIKPHLRSMVSHQYASHVLRLLILILASKNLPKTTQNNSTLRSKKSKIARKMIDIKDNDDFDRVHQTPESFKLELKEFLKILYDNFTENTVSRTDISPTLVTKFRELCVDPVASPVIQLIIQVEGIFDRERSFWRLVFSTTDEKDPKEESFVEYLLSDPVGSHFLESVISFARTKYVERLYNLYMKDRITKLAQRDTTGAFVVRALLKHLKNKEVKQILSALIPQLSILLNSNIDFGTSIIEASIQQNNFLRDEVISQLVEKYYSPQSDSRNILESCLLLSSSTLGNTRDDWPTAEERRRSLFLEQLIDYDRKFAEITVESMLALPEERLLQMCYHGVFSHVVEHVLKPTLIDTIKRKLLLNVLCKDVVNMSCNAYGSHIVDKLWDFTAKLTLYKERIANALNKEAEKVKNSSYGRQVWKNWHMEQYLRRRGDWKTLIKEQGFAIFPDAEPTKPKVNGPQNKRSFRSNLPPTKRRK
ncbi:probable Nucleolar protein 9 [Zygosaccharomyces bailii ISA1307]|uniref:Nucleolar protein 9 n=1 Tax=Zygosaccharomyces bailii (strain CLIB 213 / ATCC 58445 / CBS 680 / BCRC 21525 / NBRC 1098 / NCYC 1416 / NRRL Y-2227) TaxID=1333698 RepID=A0A8J2T5I8_ZYGB2|nr:BN860_09516g1_1 [Zygosaccharomyces bailii CLIB 213]CDH14711.1 probable Nucleolar protein 9 [Zygosaccharomyces bailii ISA1307]